MRPDTSSYYNIYLLLDNVYKHIYLHMHAPYMMYVMIMILTTKKIKLRGSIQPFNPRNFTL